MEKTKLSVKEFSQLYSISTDTAYSLIRRNEVPHVKIGRKILLDRHSIENWWKEKETQKNSAGQGR